MSSMKANTQRNRNANGVTLYQKQYAIEFLLPQRRLDFLFYSVLHLWMKANHITEDKLLTQKLLV